MTEARPTRCICCASYAILLYFRHYREEKHSNQIGGNVPLSYCISSVWWQRHGELTPPSATDHHAFIIVLWRYTPDPLASSWRRNRSDRQIWWQIHGLLDPRPSGGYSMPCHFWWRDATTKAATKKLKQFVAFRHNSKNSANGYWRQSTCLTEK